MYSKEEVSPIEALIKGQSEVLGMINQGASLSAVLNELTAWVEAHATEPLIASVFCTGDEDLHLFHCAGMSLPKDYIDAINGLIIAPGMASCGTAAYTKAAVIVENIAESTLWKDHKAIALQHNLHACWSTPLVNEHGNVRGTLAIYYDSPKKPNDSDIKLIALTAQIALLAIEFKKAKEEHKWNGQQASIEKERIEKSEQRFQNLVREATIGIIVLRGKEMIVDIVNEMYGQLIGQTPEALINKPLFQIIPEAEDPFRALLDKVRTSGQPLYLYDQPYFVKTEGKEIRGYLNIIYQPFKEFDGTITGVMVLCHDVTEIVESRKKLEQSEEQFRSLVMQAPVAIAVFKGKDLIAEIVNDDYLPLVGKTREEVMNKSIWDILPQEKNAIEPLIDELFRTSQPIFINELEINSGHNDHKIYNAVLKPYFELDGKVNGFIVVAHEITPQVEARRNSEKSEQQVRSLIESAPFPISVYVGKEMRIQFANQSIIDVWGKGNDVVGKLYTEILPELVNQQIFEQIDQVFTTGIPFHAKNQQVDLLIDGKLQPHYFNYSFTPLFDADGKVFGVMNTAAEVTELVIAYKDLEESESRARLAIEASEQGTFYVNLLTNEMVVSQRMAEIFDVEENADRSRFISAIHPDDLKVREEAYKRAYQTSILDYEGRLIKKDGFVTWIRVKGKIYFDGNNIPVRLVGIVQDISEQKIFSDALSRKVQERTEELEQANNQLVSINDELQQFAYVSSHDLQEPLRKIRFFSDIIMNKVEANGEIGPYMQKISSSAERMTGLIRSLLEYSRVSNAHLRFEKVDLNFILKIILGDYELLIDQKEAILQIDDLPEIVAVPLQINQLFFNLVGNALKFTRRGIQPVIKIKSEPLSHTRKISFPELDTGKDYIQISVEDNGIGFDQAFATQIFTVFQRLNDRSNFGGYGIGLALCRKVVQTHKGVIYAEGALKQGARFVVILPLEQ